MSTKNLTATSIILNLFIYLFLYPYAQALANQHINIGFTLRIIFFSFSIITLIYSTIIYFKKKEILKFSLLLIFALSLIIWGLKFGGLFCEGCANTK
ncbi:hypothetical protein [Chryseobacterium turcicum]|uniref:Uncharacterized protein n=1 Tax=Chryseobacterium turcicum TaxID=2898076 RepID=A0A9Q3V5D5_9FLAO|nr:hypothetical protein [Chryseobacterium turcicum]MCD1118687.1 hypothetical protein [Chryseobacterium turcicum]